MVGGTVRGALRISNYGVAVRAPAVVRSDSVAAWECDGSAQSSSPRGVSQKSDFVCHTADSAAVPDDALSCGAA